jgi:hypothetical protein
MSWLSRANYDTAWRTGAGPIRVLHCSYDAGMVEERQAQSHIELRRHRAY